MDARIVVLDGHALNPGDLDWSPLAALGQLDVYARSTSQEAIRRAAEAEIVLINKTELTGRALKQLPRLKYIGVMATGCNSVDLDVARELGVTVTNVQGYGTSSVAQHVFALVLTLANRVSEHSLAVRGGAWSACPDWCFWDYPLVELAGKTMGIVGFGQIGRATARIAAAFGMHVRVNSRTRQDEPGIEQVELAALFGTSDVLSLHCPLTEETRHVVNAERIAMMRRSAYLINTARGALVDNQALADALNTDRLAGAGLDVLDTEPPDVTEPLLSAKNCIVTPHNAWASLASRERLLQQVVENVSGFLRGSPRNVVS